MELLVNVKFLMKRTTGDYLSLNEVYEDECVSCVAIYELLKELKRNEKKSLIISKLADLGKLVKYFEKFVAWILEQMLSVRQILYRIV